MLKPNTNYANLKDSYLFYNISQKVSAYLASHSGERLLRLGIGDVSLPLCGAVIEALAYYGRYMLLPAYGAAFHMPMEAFIEMGQAIHPSINSVMTFCLLTVLPFNLFKGVLSLVTTMLLYKHIRKIIK